MLEKTRKIVDTLYSIKIKNKKTKRVFQIYKHLEIENKRKVYYVGIASLDRLNGKSIWFTRSEFDSWKNAKENAWLFEKEENEEYLVKVFSYEVYNTEYPTLKSMAQDMDFSQPIVWDIETKGLDRHRDDITSVQFDFYNKAGEHTTCFINWGSHPTKQWQILFKVLSKYTLVGHNAKFDALFIFQKLGVNNLPLSDDTFVMAHVTDNEEYGLKPCVLKYFHHDYDIKTDSKTGAVTRELMLYGLLDVIYTRRLLEVLKERIKEVDTEYVYSYELRVYRAYYKVEQTGVPIDPKRQEKREYIQGLYKPIEEELKQVANINWGSNDQLALVMFTPKDEPIYTEVTVKGYWTIKHEAKTTKGETFPIMEGKFKYKKDAQEAINKLAERVALINNIDYTIEKVEPKKELVLIGKGLGLKPKGKTASGKYKVGKDILAEYSDNSVIAKLLQWKKLTKLEQFIASWEKLQVNDRIYPSFNITARTGRTTCANPNLNFVVGSFTEMCQNKQRELMEAL